MKTGSNLQIIDHFDKVAPQYDLYKKRNSLYYNSLKDAVSSFISKKNPTILDIGCGTGEILHFLYPKHGVGIDSSSKMIKIAQKKFQTTKNLEFQTFDIGKKAYKGSFDYILLIDVIEHLSSVDVAIKNIQKSMSGKTKLIVAMANTFWEPFLMFMEKLSLKMPEGPHHRLSEKEFIILLKKHHLVINKKKYFLPTIPIPYLQNLALIYVYSIQKE